MERKYFVSIGILIIIGIIVASSGCTSQATTDPTTDLVPDNEPSVDENGPVNEWFVTGNFHSASDTPYSKVNIHLTAYNAQNKTIGQKDIVIYDIKSGDTGFYEAVIKAKGTVDHVTFSVINATKS